MASISDPFESLSDRFHAVGVALSPFESGVRLAVKDLESRFLDSRNALKQFDTKKNPPGGVVSPVIPDSEMKRCSKKGVDGSSEMEGKRKFQEGVDSCANCLHFAFLADKFQFKLFNKCSQNSDSSPSKFQLKELKKCEVGSTSLEKAKASPQKKLQAFWLERNPCLALGALVQGVNELSDRSRGIGEKKYDPSPASKPLHSHVDFLKITKGLIKGRKEDFDGFLSNIRFASVGQLSGFVGAHSSAKDELEVCSSAGSNEEPKSWLVSLSMPLSNVERLKSTLSTLSIGELIKLVPQLGRNLKDHPDKKLKDHPDKKKLFSVQDFFRYTRSEGKRFFEELDRDRDGQITLEDLEIAMRKRRLPKRYAQEFFRRTRRHIFSKSIEWKQFLSLMEQREPTILRAYTTLCLSNSGTLQRNQILTSLRSAGLPANEDNATAMMQYLNANKGGSISYSHFRNFMLLLPSERLQDDPRCTWFEAATVFPVSPPVKFVTENVLKSSLTGSLACAISTSMMHPLDTMKAVAFTILHQEGPLRIFKGVVPRFFRIAPLGAINFAGYELSKEGSEPDGGMCRRRWQ